MFYFEGIIIVFISIFGLVVGSLLNVIICRLGTKKSWLRGRSVCPNCKHQLNWLDLVPLFSFIFLRGRCRYCHKPISWQYPAVELATATVFVLIILNTKYLIPDTNIFLTNSWQLLVNILLLCLISSFLIIIFVYDLKHYLIPDAVVFTGIGLALLYQISLLITNYQLSTANYKLVSLTTFYPLLAALAAGLFFLILVLVTRGKGMGIGDIKLAFLMGLLLSWPNIAVALFIAFLSGGIIGLLLIIAKKKQLKSMVPFGPFLISGTFIALFWGVQIIQSYWGVFL